MANDYQHPLTVTISVPYEEPRRHGIYSTKHPDSTIAYARLSKVESELIESVIKDLDIKLGTFMRFCAVRVAQELEKSKHDYLKSRSA